MKKNIFLIMLLCIIMCLTGCSSKELKQKRLDMQQSNTRIEKLVRFYKVNDITAKEFDSILLSALNYNYDEFIQSVVMDDSVFLKYCEENSGYQSYLMSLKGSMYQDINNYIKNGNENYEYDISENIQFYHFLDSDKNIFNELIQVKLPTYTCLMKMEWVNGRIISMTLERV